MTRSAGARAAGPRAGLALLLLGALALGACGKGLGEDAGDGDRGQPVRGGVLKVIGSSDVDHLSTAAGYYTVTNSLFRAFTRQLVSYAPEVDWDEHIQLQPDLARELPTRANGGVSADGRTYTFHLRSGVRWNSEPPRALVAGDLLRGMKLLCNPVSPVGAPGYVRSTIDGMARFCDAFEKVDGTPAAIRTFVETHEIPGVTAPDDSTVVFSLLAPAPDFLYMMSMSFFSPVPDEYLNYVPDGAAFRQHTISLGPYQIRSYIPAREIHLGRNPVWDPATDPLRPAYVDSIDIVQGIEKESVQQQLQAGTADLAWDVQVPTADLPVILQSKDPNFIAGPPGNHWAVSYYMPINVQSPNENGALRKPEVRQALEYAVDRTGIVQVIGGPDVARPLRQTVVSEASGYREGYDPYPTPGDRGDPARAKELLAKAGYPNGLTIKLLYRTSGYGPAMAQTTQAALERAGIEAELVPATGSDFYAKYLQNPENAKRGVWDLAIASWVPDWFGNNGRSMIEALFDGRTYGVNSTNYGDYDSDATNQLIDKALTALTEEESEAAWQDAATRIMEDAAFVPLTESKQNVYHAARVKHCSFNNSSFNCDFTAVWLSGQGAGSRP